VLAAIDTAEARRRTIATLYADPGFFQRTPGDEVKSLEREDAELTSQLERWLAEWEAIEKELAELSVS